MVYYRQAAWLTAFVTPLFKKGKSVSANNYGPIGLALRCTMCKLSEAIIKDQMVQFLIDKGLINKHQHAFINKHSTFTNLLESTQDWLVSLNSPLAHRRCLYGVFESIWFYSCF
jgi:hypothetical protein